MSTTEQQTPQIDAMMGQLVGHQRFFSAMSGQSRQWVFEKPQEAIGLICDAIDRRDAKPTDALFEFVASFTVPGRKQFAAKEHYTIDTAETARVRISYLGDNLREHLWSKVEHDIAPADLKLQKLRRPQTDLPKNPEQPGTIFGLGGFDKADVGLYGFFETLAHKQAVGDRTWTVGFAYDDNGVLWTLRARWHGDGWYVEAHSSGYRDGWHGGHEFVSR